MSNTILVSIASRACMYYLSFLLVHCGRYENYRVFGGAVIKKAKGEQEIPHRAVRNLASRPKDAA